MRDGFYSLSNKINLNKVLDKQLLYIYIFFEAAIYRLFVQEIFHNNQIE